MKSVLCWMGALACCGNLLWAEETPSSKTPAAEKSEVSLEKQIRVQVEFIEVPHEQLTELLFMREAKLDATPLRKEVQELVKQGKAKVLETQICAAPNGQQAKGESTSEYTFPTKFQYQESEKKGALSAIVPGDFEIQSLGNSLEIEPTLSENGTSIDLCFASEIRWLTGETLWLTRKDEKGNVFQVKMPRFYVQKLDGRTVLKSGQYGFFATLTPKDAAGNMDASRKVMVFVQTTLLETK